MNVPLLAIERALDPASESALSPEAALDLAAADFAARAGALADLLQRWRRPALARTVLASLLAGDGETFRELLRDFDPPVSGKCWWLRDVVEKIVGAVEFRNVCRLRTDLTAGERALFVQLLLRHRQEGNALPLAGTGGDPYQQVALGPAISPGPFLDVLRDEGLVCCSDEPIQGAAV
jgi:hypothetical protein